MVVATVQSFVHVEVCCNKHQNPVHALPVHALSSETNWLSTGTVLRTYTTAVGQDKIQTEREVGVKVHKRSASCVRHNSSISGSKVA